MNNSSHVAAIVLAAGMSRRMVNAAPKQLLRLAAKTLLEHTLANVRGSNVDQVVLVLGAAADEIRAQVPTSELTVVVNADYAQGMGTSLRCGVAALFPETQAVLVVLADQPFVGSATLNQLIADYLQSRPQVLIPTYRGFRGNPVLLDRSLFPELMTLAGDVGCRAIFGSHTQGIHKLAVGDPGILLDVDSTEDWKTLSAHEDPVARICGMSEIETLQEPSPDQPDLVIVGRDQVAQALAALAQLMHFNVTVVDPRLDRRDLSASCSGGLSGGGDREHESEVNRILRVLDFSRLGAGDRYIFVASRGQFDEDAIEEAFHSGAAYIGLLANRRRSDEIFKSFRARGMAEDKLSTLHAPAGLDIGAHTAQEIALSILAEITAVRRQQSM